MEFIEALALLKAGKAVQRYHWQQEHTIPATEVNADLPKSDPRRRRVPAQDVVLSASVALDASSGRMTMVTQDGRRITWLPGHEDLAADDWQEAK